MGANLILLCVGIIICFGGIRFKRLFSAITGAAWGALLGVIITFLTASSIYDIDDKMGIYIITCALVTCILCAIFDSLCTIITSFITAFSICIIILLLLPLSDVIYIILLIAVVIASVIAYLAYLFDKIAFILVTAFSGAFIANIGGFGIIKQMSLDEMLLRVVFGNTSSFSIIFIGTIILGIIGCYIQNLRITNCGSSSFSKEAPLQLNMSEVMSPFIVKLKSLFDDVDSLLFLIPCIAYVVIPLLLWELHLERNIYVFLLQMERFLEIVSLSILIYLVITQDKKRNIIYQLPYLLMQIWTDLKYYKNFWSIYRLLELFRLAVTGIGLYCVSQKIKDEQKKPLFLAGLAYFIYYIAFPFIEGNLSGAGYSFHITKHILPIFITYITVAILFWIRKKTNIISFFAKISYKQIWINVATSITTNKNSTENTSDRKKKNIIIVIGFTIIVIIAITIYFTVFNTTKGTLDYTNPIITEISENGSYTLEIGQVYTLDLDLDGQEDTLEFCIDFFKGYGHLMYFNINNEMFILEDFADDWDSYTNYTRAYYGKSELRLNSDNEIMIAVYIPSEYGYEESELQYSKNGLKGDDLSIRQVS